MPSLICYLNHVLALLISYAVDKSSAVYVTGEPSIGTDDNGNPIYSPQAGDTIVAGSLITILWTPIHATNLVSIELWNVNNSIATIVGQSCSVDDVCSTLAQNLPNNGKFVWEVPSQLPANNEYFLDLYEPNVSNISYFTTGLFTIVSNTTSNTTEIMTSTSSSASALLTMSTSLRTSHSATTITNPQTTSSMAALGTSAIGVCT